MSAIEVRAYPCSRNNSPAASSSTAQEEARGRPERLGEVMLPWYEHRRAEQALSEPGQHPGTLAWQSSDRRIMTHAQDARTIRQLSEYLEQWLSYRASYLRVPGVQAAVRVGSELVLDVGHPQIGRAIREPLQKVLAELPDGAGVL